MAEGGPGAAGPGSWIDRLIDEARRRGEFENLPGYGRPLPDIDEPHDDLRWVKKKLRSEGASFLPATLAIRKDVEDSLALAAAARSEERVRAIVAELNARIRRVNRTATSGPPSTTAPLDVEAVVEQWRAGRGHS